MWKPAGAGRSCQIYDDVTIELIVSEHRLVEILRIESDLASGIAAFELEDATRGCLAEITRVPRGPWEPASPAPDFVEGFGFLVLSGFLVRRVGSSERHGAELLGPGDLLRPWQTIGPVASSPYEPTWSVAQPLTLAVLGGDFVARAASWPSVAVALVDRAMLRARHLALTMAALQESRVDRRLHAFLWQLADRWGRTDAHGVTIELPLTHELLAELVTARRPSVSTALAGLAAAGVVERDGRRWRLHGGPPDSTPST
jgi:hypothetical protein